MRLTILALSSLALVAAAPAPADRQQLEQLAALNDHYWNEKDVERISGQYADDATVRIGHAQVLQGKAGIRAFFAAAFSRREGEFRHVSKVEHLEVLSPDLVLADNQVRVERADGKGGWAPVREFRTNSLAVRDGATWKLRAVRGHPLAPQ